MPRYRLTPKYGLVCSQHRSLGTSPKLSGFLMILRPASLPKAYSLCSTTQSILGWVLFHQFLVRLLPYLCPPPHLLPNSRLSIHEKAKGKGPNLMRWKNSKRKTTEQLTAGPSCLSQIRHFFCHHVNEAARNYPGPPVQPFPQAQPQGGRQCPVRLGC